jgi:hypothetical protein
MRPRFKPVRSVRIGGFQRPSKVLGQLVKKPERVMNV